MQHKKQKYKVSLPNRKSATNRKSVSYKKASNKFFKKHKIEIISLIIILLLVVFNIVYKYIPIFVEQYHSRFFYKIFMIPFTYITAYLPFSLIEILVPLAVITAIILLIFKRKYIVKVLCFTLCYCFFFYTIALSMNYSRQPADINFDVAVMVSNKQDVAKALLFTVEKLNGFAENIKYTNGVSSYEKTISQMSSATNDSYNTLSQKYDFLKGGVAFPKPMLSSKLMSYTGICGFFSPITFEANIDIDFPQFSLPQTMCHEGAHLKGFARENECEFISFIACINSSDLYFQYSGYMSAFNQLAVELAKADKDLYLSIIKDLNKNIMSEWKAYSDYSKKHEGKTEKISNSINNAYIVSQGEDSGVASYSEGVELIIAYVKTLPDFPLN